MRACWRDMCKAGGAFPPCSMHPTNPAVVDATPPRHARGSCFFLPPPCRYRNLWSSCCAAGSSVLRRLLKSDALSVKTASTGTHPRQGDAPGRARLSKNDHLILSCFRQASCPRDNQYRLGFWVLGLSGKLRPVCSRNSLLPAAPIVQGAHCTRRPCRDGI